MKPNTKKWVLIAGGTAAVLGLAALAAPFFIPWDKVKDQVVAQASKALGRDLSIGKVEVGFFTGVRVKDIRLANAGEGFSKQPLFSNAEAKLNVSLLSVFTGKLVINSIVFDQPQVLIETNAQGKSNLPGTGAAKAAAVKDKKPEGKATAFPVVLASLHIKDGQVVVRNKKAKSETAIKGLDLKLMGLSLAAAGGSRLELKLDAEVEGKKIPLNITSNFKLDLAGDSLDIRSLEAVAPALALSAKILVKDLSRAPAVDGGLQLELKLADLDQLLPPSRLKKLPGELKGAGLVSLNVQAKGGAADLKAMDLKAQLAFHGVDLAYGGYPALSGMQGTLALTKAGAELPALTFKLGGDPATLAFKAAWGDLAALLGPTDKLKAEVSLSLRSPKLNLDPLLAIAMVEDTPAEAAAKAAQMKDLSVPKLKSSVPAGLSFQSLIEVDSLVARGVSTGKLKQQARLKNRVFSSTTDLALYDGQFWERTQSDLATAGPLWKSQAGLSKLDFAPFIADLAKALPKNAAVQELNGKLSGSLGFKADLKGKGFKRSLRFRNLAATGSFYMKDGELKKLTVQEKLAAAIPHPQTQAVLRSDIVFSNAVGEFTHADKRFTLKRFTLGSGDDWRAGDLMLQASGYLVGGGPLDFKVIPRFNPAKVQLEGTLGDAFKDAQGWPSYDPIVYAGPSAREAKADFKAGLQKAAKQAVQKQVDDVKTKAQDALKEKAGDALKGLFGR